VTYLKLLLTAVMEQKASNCQRTITGDESQFFLYYPGDSVSGASREGHPQRVKQKTVTAKCLVSILWSVNRISSLLDVPKATTYSRAFFTDAVMPSLIETVSSRTRRKTRKGWLIHMDNAHPHNLGGARRCVEASRAERLPHLAYSSDLTPNDFFLFECIKKII
jgi:hypothetical protein